MILLNNRYRKSDLSSVRKKKLLKYLNKKELAFTPRIYIYIFVLSILLLNENL